MQKFIEKELSKDSRTKLDLCIFNRETKSFYENTPEMMLSAAGNTFFLINGEKIPVDKIVIQRYIGVQNMFETLEKDTEEWEKRDFLSTARFMSRRY